MPQLDKVTFFSQFFWLCVFFFGFYVFALKYFLPEMSRILKFRKKRLGESLSQVQGQENANVRGSTERLLENTLKNAKQIFKQNSLKNEEWLLDYTKKFNKNNLEKGNNAYLLSIGEKSLSHNLSMQGVNNEFSSAIFLSLLTQRMLLLKKTLFLKKNASSHISSLSRNVVTKSKTNKPSASNTGKASSTVKGFTQPSEKAKSTTQASTKASKKKGK